MYTATATAQATPTWSQFLQPFYFIRSKTMASRNAASDMAVPKPELDHAQLLTLSSANALAWLPYILTTFHDRVTAETG